MYVCRDEVMFYSRASATRMCICWGRGYVLRCRVCVYVCVPQMKQRIIVKCRLIFSIIVPYSTRYGFYLLSNVVNKSQYPCSLPQPVEHVSKKVNKQVSE